ncbi:MAG: hypothetical protein AB7O04_00840 [Hyphomonadaceae bacterium]
MNGRPPPSLDPFGDDPLAEYEAAAPSSASGAWADVSGGMHFLQTPDADTFNKGRRAEDRAASGLGDALDAFAAGHALTLNEGFGDGGLGDGGLGDQSFGAPPARTGARAGAGHLLLDDAGGRFTIDPASGIVSLKDASARRHELGHIHSVRVRSVGPDGAAYDSTFHLRIAEPLPEVVLPNGADPLGLEHDPFAAFAAEPLSAALLSSEFGAPMRLAPPPMPALKAWSEIAAALGAVAARSAAQDNAPYGAALGECARAFPAVHVSALRITLDETPPSPMPRSARWLDA